MALADLTWGTDTGFGGSVENTKTATFAESVSHGEFSFWGCICCSLRMDLYSRY